MPLPTVSRPYPLGPYSLETPTGRYWFPGSFAASHLIPGRAQEEMVRGEDSEVWERLGDGERMPEILTLRGSLVEFSGLDGLRQDVRDLRNALENTTILIRNTGDGNHREITIDGGLVTIQPSGKHHYRAVVTIYPTGDAITTAVATSPPTLHNLTTEAGEDLTTEAGEILLAVS